MDHSMHANMDHSTHGDIGSSMNMCKMNMVFTWDPTDMCVVFRWWHVRTTTDLVLTLLAIAALGAGYEYLRRASRLIDAGEVG